MRIARMTGSLSQYIPYFMNATPDTNEHTYFQNKYITPNIHHINIPIHHTNTFINHPFINHTPTAWLNKKNNPYYLNQSPARIHPTI